MIKSLALEYEDGGYCTASIGPNTDRPGRYVLSVSCNEPYYGDYGPRRDFRRQPDPGRPGYPAAAAGGAVV